MALHPLTEGSIQRYLSKFFVNSTIRYEMDGLYVFSWESDKLIETRSGYIYEFEIKISRSDYANDFKHKAEKHIVLWSNIASFDKMDILLQNLYSEKRKKYPGLTMDVFKERWGNRDYIVGQKKSPNYFYYVVPNGMIQPCEVPQYAGLIYVSNEGLLQIVKSAPMLHKQKYTDVELNLSEKFYYNMMSFKRRFRKSQKDVEDVSQSLDRELKSKGHDRTWEQMEKDLKKAQDKAALYYKLYMDMVEGADYNSIERHLLLDELEECGVDVRQRYKEIMSEANQKYKERYPDRK